MGGLRVALEVQIESVYTNKYSAEKENFKLSVRVALIPVPHSSFASFFCKVPLKRKLRRQGQVVLPVLRSMVRLILCAIDRYC